MQKKNLRAFFAPRDDQKNIKEIDDLILKRSSLDKAQEVYRKK